MSKAPAWKFFDDLGNGKAKCRTCEKIISCKGGTTTPMNSHLKLHPDVHKEFEQSKKRPSTSTQESTAKQAKLDFSIPIVSNEALQKNLDEAIVEFLAESQCAFRIVDLESFKKMFSVLNSKVKVRSREFYSQKVTTTVDEMRKDMLSFLECLN